MAQEKYDYIIAGGGMAGLSLAFYLNQSRLREKKILIIDRAVKNQNDHTWCFWQKEKSVFEEIIFLQWCGVWFHGSGNFSKFLNLGEYSYKMIRAVDFYEFIAKILRANENFTFLQTEIQKIDSNGEQAVVTTAAGEFYAEEYVFDSFTRQTYDDPRYQNLWQHFAGWTIETDGEVFDPQKPTLFDFRVAQKNECRFAYILPFSPKRALIEFTVFSDNLLSAEEYELNLREYIAKILKIENYQIIETENGVIPMSDQPHEIFPQSKVIRIGTAGGYVKSSTGYSFERTQRRLRKIVADLESFPTAQPDFKSNSWKAYLDSVLLNVLRTKKHPAADVFTSLFEHNAASQVLKFLDEDTNLAEDLRIMRSVPLAPFTKAAVETAWAARR